MAAKIRKQAILNARCEAVNPQAMMPQWFQAWVNEQDAREVARHLAENARREEENARREEENARREEENARREEENACQDARRRNDMIVRFFFFFSPSSAHLFLSSDLCSTPQRLVNHAISPPPNDRLTPMVREKGNAGEPSNSQICLQCFCFSFCFCFVLFFVFLFCSDSALFFSFFFRVCQSDS
jgi:hypothetical protein